MVKQIFINLVVKDLEETKKFWTALGFSFNPQFTDENAASLVLGENIFAMLILPSFFTRFTKKELADATKTTEAINSLGVESREEVDRIVEKALSSGGIQTRDAEDYGWMYGRSFEDLDGHQWEVTYIDINSVPEHPGEEVK
jgi:uncharacterized protein